MAELKDTIAKYFPEATVEEGDILLMNIPDEKWHETAKTLRDNAEFGFDFLVTIVGMDWNCCKILAAVPCYC